MAHPVIARKPSCAFSAAALRRRRPRPGAESRHSGTRGGRISVRPLHQPGRPGGEGAAAPLDSSPMATHERGQLFLGGVLDPETGEQTEHLTYDARDLTTHGVIVGMTGSGKTGLGIIALEEALLSGIPTLVIDPKGDMGNLLLNFPSFDPAAFEPWVDAAEAERKGITASDLAASTAEMWKSGLEGWGIGSDRMRELGMNAGFSIYTPGSSAGIPLNIVGSLAAPDIDWATDAETGRDEIEGFVSSLLVLAGIAADPISSPEHILLANIIETAWSAGKDLDLAGLIGQVLQPPFRKLGVFELDAFFPAKDRQKLAMRLNGLVASPSFSAWMEGPALDIQSMLYTADGRPKASIVYLPHLGEEQRQFIVTLLLSKVVSWMRSQPGTSDLRALIYMDEVFGFAPPTAEPPSKKPILTILKQARAHGVGMILSTQNPVDLDYKAMSNAGTWMVGRLQTERDKARILEGLTSASGDVDVAAFDRLIGDLGKRQFVLHTTRSSAPQTFSTRWAMSYLRGPLTRDEVSRLTADAPERQAAAPTPGAASADETGPPDDSNAIGDGESPVAPQIADGVTVSYMDPGAPWAELIGADGASTTYEAAVIARVHLTFDDQYADLRHDEVWEAVCHPLGAQFDAERAIAVDYDDRDLRSEPPAGASYVFPDAPLDTKSFFTKAQSEVKAFLHRNQTVEVLKNKPLKLYSRIGETADEFAARCAAAAEDAADADVAKLKERYKKKIRSVESQLATAENRVRELSVDVEQRRQEELVSGAGDLLGAFLGGRRRSSGLSRAASRRSQTRRTQERLRSAEDKMNAKLAALDDLEDELAQEFQEISSKWDEIAQNVETVEIGLEKTDISVDDLGVIWIPR